MIVVDIEYEQTVPAVFKVVSNAGCCDIQPTSNRSVVGNGRAEKHEKENDMLQRRSIETHPSKLPDDISRGACCQMLVDTEVDIGAHESDGTVSHRKVSSPDMVAAEVINVVRG